MPFIADTAVEPTFIPDAPPASQIDDARLDATKAVESSNGKHLYGPMTRHGQALGPYQILASNAEAAGIDPMDETQARPWAKKYLQDNEKKFGSVELAHAAYNAGPGNVNKAIRQAGSSNWNDVKQYLPKETQNYVDKISKLIPSAVSSAQAAPAPTFVPDEPTFVPDSTAFTPDDNSVFGKLKAAASDLAPDALNKFTEDSVGILRGAIHKTFDAFKNNADEAMQGLAVNVPVALAGYGVAMVKKYSELFNPSHRTFGESLDSFNKDSNIVNAWLHDTFPNLKTKGKSFEDSVALLGVPQEIFHAAGEAIGGGEPGAAIELLGMIALAKPELKAKAAKGKLPELTPEQIEILKKTKEEGLHEENLMKEPTQQAPLDLGPEEASHEGRPSQLNPKDLTTDEHGIPYDATKSTELATEEAKGARPRMADLVDKAEEADLVDRYKLNDEPKSEAKAEPFFTKEAMDAANQGPVVRMSPIDYGRYTSQRELGANSESASKYASIERGLKEGGLNEVPKLTVDKVGDQWMVVDHDGRHRSDMLLKAGAKDMPVRIIDDSTSQSFLKDNPKELKSQDGGVLKNPAFDLKPRKINKGTFGQSGAINIFSHNDTPIRAAEWDKAKAVVGRMDMTANEFMAKHAAPTIDVRKRLGAATGSFRTLNELVKKVNVKEHAIHTLAYLDDTMHLMKEKFERKIIENIYPHTTAFLRYYRTTTGLGFMTMYKTLKADMKVAQWFEKNRDEWFNGTDYAPTVVQMMDKGMSKASALAWDHLYKGWEATWPDLLTFAQEKGIAMPPRIPGYLPHFTQGAWRVRLYADRGEGSPHYLATIGAKDAKDAARLQKLADQLIDPKDPEQANWRTSIEEPRTENDMATMISGLFETQEKFTKGGKLSALLNKLYEQATVGSLSSALERQKSPQILHQLERISMEGSDFELTPAQARQALIKMKQLMEAIPAMKMRGDFVTKVLWPLEQHDYFKKTPKMRKAAEEYIKQFLHIPDTSAGHVDGWLKDIAQAMGKDPELPIHAIKLAYSAGSKFYLFYKPAYWAQQVFQNMLTAGALWTAKSMLLTYGIERGSVFKAIVEDFASTSRGTKLSSGESLHSYMEKSGHATPTFIENMDQSKLTQDPIARGVEKYTRQAGGRLGYSLFKQVFDEAQALHASGKLTDMMNVPYDTELGKPFAFSKEGQFAKPVTMFMQFPAHMFQFYSYQMKAMVEASKVSPQAFAHAATGLAYTLVASVVLGGLGGIIGSSTYDTLIKAINNTFGTNWPVTKQIARNSKEAFQNLNFKDEYSNLLAKFFEFGVPSMVSKMDISGSMRGPDLMRPEAFFHFLNVVGSAALMGARWATTDLVSKKEMGEKLRDLPAPLRGTTEHLLRDKTYGQVFDEIRSGKGEWAPRYNDVTLKGDYHRDSWDMIINLLGMRSTGEAASNTTHTLDAQRQQALSLQATRLVDNIAEEPRSPKNPARLKELVAITQLGGAEATTVFQAIQKYQQEKNITETQSRELGLNSLESLGRYKRWLEEKKLEPK